ncbi:hypothetical protein Tco_0193900 [Tanacetum coccineum]
MIIGGKIEKANKKSLNAKGNYNVKGKGKDKKVYVPKPKNPKPIAKERPAKDDDCHHTKKSWEGVDLRRNQEQRRTSPLNTAIFLKRWKDLVLDHTTRRRDSDS